MSFVKSDSHSAGEDNLLTTPTSKTYVELPLRCLHFWASFLTIKCNIILALLQFCDKTFYAVFFVRMKAESLTFDNSDI
jgi:N-dimethylarginine dimethylaminohydrolase